VGPRSGLYAVAKRKIPSSPCWDSNPRSSIPQLTDIPLTYPGSLVVIINFKRMFRTEFGGVIYDYFHNMRRVIKATGSLIIEKKDCGNKCCIFLEDLLLHKILGPYIK
jgi:hypothetical protein